MSQRQLTLLGKNTPVTPFDFTAFREFIMFFIDVLSRVVHVGTAITLVGGSLFMLLVLMPSAKELDESPHKQLAAAVGGRWKRFVHLGILLFLISGFYNYFRAMPKHEGDSLYHALVGTKILIAMVVFFFASALVGRSAKFEGIRANRSKWLSITVVLAMIVVCISGFVKIRGLP